MGGGGGIGLGCEVLGVLCPSAADQLNKYTSKNKQPTTRLLLQLRRKDDHADLRTHTARTSKSKHDDEPISISTLSF